MARRSTRSDPRTTPEKKSVGKPPKGDRRDAGKSAHDRTRRVTVMIWAGFSALSLLILIISWPGYQLDRHTALAEAAMADDRFEDAAKHLQYILDRYKRAWVRWNQMGICYLEMNQPNKAIDCFNTSLALKRGQNHDARFGHAYYLLGQKEKAFEYLNAAIKAEPDNPESAFYIALIQMQSEDYIDAALFFQIASADSNLFEKAKPYLAEIRSKLLGE